MRLRITKFICVTICFLLGTSLVKAQLSGVKNIPGDYATVTAAVAAINTQGVGTGGVTFQIAAGYTETLTAQITLTATGSTGNPIVFKKTGSGANPLITAYTGVLTLANTSYTTPEGIWQFVGSDYVTIDGIDLLDPAIAEPAAMDFGYGFFKTSATDGCQYDTVRNCNITLTRNSNAAGPSGWHNGSIGIIFTNVTPTTLGTQLTVTATSGSNSYNAIYSNTISNCNAGISFNGYGASSPFILGDTGNDIGGNSSATGNNILNFGGATGAANPATGIFINNQWGINASYNVINNNNGSGVSHVNTLRGIFWNSSSTSASGNINNNTITISSGATTSQVSCIENAAGSTAAGNTININNNLITNCTSNLATTQVWYGIYNSAAPANLNVINNVFSNNTTKATSGSTYQIYNTGAVASTINLNNNSLSFSNVNSAAYTGTLYSIYNSSGTTSTGVSMSGNQFSNYNFTTTGSGSIYFVYNTNSSNYLTLNSNTWNNLNLNHSGSEYLIYNASSTQTALFVDSNSIQTGFTRTAASGSMYCYYAGSSSLGTSTQNFHDNNFSNITSTTSGSGTFYLFYNSDGASSPYPKKFIYNNTLNNINYNTTGTAYCLYMSYFGDGSTTSGSEMHDNTITNIATAGTIYGLYPTSTASPTYAGKVYNNVVDNISSSGSASVVYGAYIGATTPGLLFYKNKIGDISVSGSTAKAYGVYTLSSAPYTIYNNAIGNINATTSTQTAPTPAAVGLYLSSGTTINAYYNSIYLAATVGGTNFGTAGIYASATPTVNLTDNIVVNNSIHNGTGYSIAYQRSSTTQSTYATASNNNLFYAGTASSSNLLYYDGTNSDQTLTTYKARVSPADNSSITWNPAFLSTTGVGANFLHIDPTVATPIESGGVAISGYTDDIDGQTRNNPPDIGADEFNGIYLDIVAPTISYTALSNTCNTGNRTITGVNITDFGGTPTSGLLIPRLYYKVNSGSYSSVAGTLTSGNGNSGTWSFTITGTFNIGDVVSYYIVAQDNAGNITANPAIGFVATDVNTVTTPPTTPATYAIGGTLSGTYLVGASQVSPNYTTLTSAITAYNNGCLSGPVVFELTDATYGPSETFPIVVNNNIYASTINTLTIRPQLGYSGTMALTSANTTATLDLNGAHNVTIDGRAGGVGSSQQLQIINTATAGSTLRLYNDATSDKINYVELQGQNTSSTSASAGVINIGGTTTTALAGNDKDTISNCNIHGVNNSTSVPTIGIASSGNTTNAVSYNDSIVVNNCNIYDFFNAGSASTGLKVDVGNSAWTITNNSLYQTATRTYTTANSHRGFWVTPNTASLTPQASGYIITGNYIGGSAPLAASGAYTMNGTIASVFYGMDISVGLGAATIVQNNTISNISLTTASTGNMFLGISQANGNVSILNNTIGSSTTTGAIAVTSTATGGTVFGIRTGGGTSVTVNMNNNTVGGINANGGTAIAVNLNGIALAGGSGVFNIKNNTIGSSTIANSLNASSLTTAGQSVIGINITSGTTDTVSNNTISNLSATGGGTGAMTVSGISITSGTSSLVNNNSISVLNNTGTGSGYVRGIYLSSTTPVITGNTINNLTSASTVTTAGASAAAVGLVMSSTSGAAIVSGNTIYNINNTATSAATNVVGMYFGGITTSSSTISKNFIHSLGNTSTSTTAYVTGMDLGAGLFTLANNMVRVGIDANGNSLANSLIVRGITRGTGTPGSNIYFNSVYVGGTVTSTNAVNTFAFQRNGLPTTGTTDDIRDNIFVNERSNATTGGKHYAFWSATSAAQLNINYNLYRYNGTGGIYASINGGTSDIASYYGGAVSGDLYSIVGNPQFINATGNAGSANLHISTTVATPIEGSGTAIATITDDYDGDIRTNNTPTDIGADAGNFIPQDVSAPVITYTTLGVSCSTGDRTFTATITDNSGVPTTGLLMPRVYFKKATGSYVSEPGTLVSGTGTNGTWNFTIAAADMGGLLTTDVVSFYVVAQDVLGNIGSNPGGVIATDVNTITTAPTSPNSYNLNGVSLSGNYTVGVGGNYTTLTAAVADYNNGCLNGPVTFSLTDATYPSETFPISINTNLNASAINTLTIKPATGITPTISGAVASGALIKLVAARYVTIDGSNSNGIDRSLTITNTSTTSPTAVGIVSNGVGAGSLSDTVKNCNINTAANTAAIGYGVAIGGSTPGTSGADNDSITIKNNNITLATISIYAYGTAAASSGGMDALNIIGNNVNSTTTATTLTNIGIQVGYAVNSSVTSDSVYVYLNYSSGSYSPVGISIENGFINSIVSKNNIYGVNTSETGGYGGRGITVGTGQTGSNLTIANNFISGVNGSNFSGFSNSSSFGIGLGMINGSSTITTTTGGINLYNNSVYLNGSSSYSSAVNTAALYVGSGASGLDIRDNIFANTITNISGSKAYAIYSAATISAFTTIDYNDYGVNTANQGVLAYIGSDQTTLAAIQTAFGGNVNSKTILPTFNSSSDLHIGSTTNYLLDNMGTPLASVTKDIDGVTRSLTTPDVGATEFTIPVCTGVTAGIASATGQTTFCVSGSSTLSATGYTASTTQGVTTYQWQSSTDDFSTSSDISGATNPASFATGTLTATTYYRLKVSCAPSGINVYSDTVVITVNPTIAGNTIGTDQTICSGSSPASLTGAAPTGGSGTYSYQWQSSTTSSTSGFANASGTSTNAGYSPAALTATTYYRRYVVSGSCSDTSSSVTITVNPTIAGNTIGSNQTICSGSSPASLTGAVPTGGSGTYAYQWQSSTTSATSGFANAIGTSTNAGYSPAALTATTYYRRYVVSGSCSDTSAAVTITINPTIAGNTIGSNQTICSGSSPASLTGAVPTGGSGTYAYQWQSSTTSATSGFANASGTSTNAGYSPAALTTTTYYRRYVVSGSCSDTSAVVIINTTTPVAGNTITASQTICSGSSPAILTGSVPTGGSTNNFRMTEDFNSGSLPANWSLNDPSFLLSSSSTVNSFGRPAPTGAIYADNYNVSSGTAQLVSKIFTATTGFDSLSFDVAAANYPGYGPDTLVVLASSGAGFNNVATFITSSTIDIPAGITTSAAVSSAFTPTSAQWFTKRLGLPQGTTQVRFDFKSGYGNDIWIDKVSVDSNYSVQWLSSTTSATSGFTAAAGSNSGKNYSPGALTQTTYYRRVVASGACSADTTTAVTITVNPTIAGNTIGSNQTICSGSSPASLTGAVPTGGSGTYAYQWQSSTTSATSGFANASGTSTNAGYSPAALTATTYYRRYVVSGSCSDTSAVVTITVNPTIAGNTIGSNQTICSGSSPASLTGAVPTGGSGTYTYQWQSSTTSATSGFANASGTSTNAGYSPAALTVTTYYRRYVVSGSCSDTSAAVTITINPTIAGNTIGSNQTICSGSSPASLTGAVPTGGSGTYTYQWQSSTTSATSGFANASGTSTNAGYSPAALTATTYYRRYVVSGSCSDTSAAVTITINPTIAGNTIGSNQAICSGSSPASLTGAVPTGGSGTYTYQWQSSTTSATTGFANASGTSTNAGYSPAALTATTYYRRYVVSGSCSDTSAAVTITVTPAIGNNTISSAQSICSGNAPEALTGSTPTGGSGTYTYLWESSTTSGTTGFTNASGTNNSINYAPGYLSQTTWFRRTVISGTCTNDVSSAIMITVSSMSSTLASTGSSSTYNQADANTNIYTSSGCNPILKIADNTGGNTLGTSTASVTVDATVQSVNGQPYLQRHFLVTVGNNTGVSATVTLYATQAEFNSFNTSAGTFPLLPTGGVDNGNVRVTKFTGTTPASGTGTLITPTVIWNGTNNYWEISFPVTSFSSFYIHTGTLGPLDIVLRDISATNIGNRNRVDWSTENETGSDKFDIERSTDGNNFSYLGTVNAKGQSSAYSYWDETPANGINYYRLKMLNKSGSFNYSKTVSAFVKSNGAFVVEAYPNPVSDLLTVKTTGKTGNNATIVLTDMTGKLIKEVKVENALTQINMKDIAQGMYLVKYIDDDHSQTIKVNKY